MRIGIVATALMVTILACVSHSQQVTSDTGVQETASNKLFVGQALDVAKRTLTKQGIEYAEGGFAFANVNPDQANLIVIIDRNHTYACVHYSKSQSKVTGLQMVFFPSRRQHDKGNESWLTATTLQFNKDRTYSVRFSPPLTDDELKRNE